MTTAARHLQIGERSGAASQDRSLRGSMVDVVKQCDGGHTTFRGLPLKLALAGVTLALSLLACEGALRVIGFPDASECMSRSRLVSAGVLSAANVGRHVGLAPPTPFTITGHPFAGYVLNPDHPDHDGIYRRTGSTPGPGKVRVVCMGGSSTYGTRVDWPGSYPAALQRELGDGYEVRNAGVIGYTTAHVAGLLASQIVHDGADVVLLYVGFNDLTMRMRHAGYRDDYLHALRFYDERGPLNLHRTRHAMGPTTESNVAGSTFAAFGDNLRTIIAVCRAHAIEPVLIYQATAFTAKPAECDAPEAWARLHAEQMLLVELIAADLNVRTIDVRQMNDVADYFADCLHMTAAGNARRAALIADALR